MADGIHATTVAAARNDLSESQLTDHKHGALDTESSPPSDVNRQAEITDESRAPTDPPHGTDEASLTMTHSDPANIADMGSEMDITTDQIGNAENAGFNTALEDGTPAPTKEHELEYQPTAEEIEAARMWEQINDQEAQSRPLTDQERADAELALLVQAQLEGGYDSDNDHDTAPEGFECACGDTFTWQQALDMTTLNCGHVRCNDCLNQNVAVGLELKRSYPPRCCGVGIEVELVQDHLSDENILRWVAVRDEFEDRAPIYCAVKTCSVYLTKDTLDTDRKWALCPNCKVRTCSGCLCLEPDHIELDKCPERIDKMDKELMTKEKWKPCPGCKHMIERIEGCDHMICECGEEFCYQCGRTYVGGMPCNCHGQRDWVDEEPEANDPAMQQQILHNLNRIPAVPGEPDIVEDTEDDNGGEGVGNEWVFPPPHWGFGRLNDERDQANGDEQEDEEESGGRRVVEAAQPGLEQPLQPPATLLNPHQLGVVPQGDEQRRAVRWDDPAVGNQRRDWAADLPDSPW